MSRQNISKELKRFIRERIQTVPRLEVLLLLHQHRHGALTLAEVEEELGLENGAAEEQLIALESNDLIVQTKECRYKYQPLSSSAESMVDQLAANYAKQRVPILSMILSEHDDRIRVFAEAFKVIRRNH